MSQFASLGVTLKKLLHQDVLKRPWWQTCHASSCIKTGDKDFLQISVKWQIRSQDVTTNLGGRHAMLHHQVGRHTCCRSGYSCFIYVSYMFHLYFINVSFMAHLCFIYVSHMFHICMLQYMAKLLVLFGHSYGEIHFRFAQPHLIDQCSVWNLLQPMTQI